MGNGTERDCLRGSPLLHGNSRVIFCLLRDIPVACANNIISQEIIIYDCLPSWVVLGDLSAIGKYYLCNTCYSPTSCWKCSSSFGLMPCCISHSLFSFVTKPVWFPVLKLYRTAAPVNVVFLIFSISVLPDPVSSSLLAYKLHCWLDCFLRSELSYSFHGHVIWLKEKTDNLSFLKSVTVLSCIKSS